MQPVWTIRGRIYDPAPLTEGGGAASIDRASSPFHIWGIVNVTPDSFSDGGLYFSPAAALEHARKLTSEGATVLDIGGASSRPGAVDVPVAEELRRVLPVVRELVEERVAIPSPGARLHRADEMPPAVDKQAQKFLISVDTWRAEVADAVLSAGADVLNDISACAWDPALREIIASYKAGYVLMHCQGRPGIMQNAPRYDDVIADVLAFFEKEMDGLVAAGLPETNIVLDPGIGFGKTMEHNVALLAGMERLKTLGRPILLGVSRKSLFGDLLGLSSGERGEATRVCTALMAARGVFHHRVHDVAATRRALTLVRCFSPL